MRRPMPGITRFGQISNGTMTVVARNGTSRLQRRCRSGHALRRLNWAQWVAVDAADNLYIADST